MKARISALMDGELQDMEFAELMRALREDGEALETWREYHLISDALRDTQLLSSGFSLRVAARLAEEPTVLSPARLPQRAARNRWVGRAAASLAAVALVGWLGLEFSPGTQQVAKAPAQSTQVAESAVPLPSAASDYLLAHQSYSPRGSLQGVAAYVRTVTDKAPAR